MKPIASAIRYDFLSQASATFFLAAAKQNAFCPPDEHSYAGHGWDLSGTGELSSSEICLPYVIAERELARAAIDGWVQEQLRRTNDQRPPSKSELKDIEAQVIQEKRLQMPYLTRDVLCLVSFKYQCFWVLSKSASIFDRIIKYTNGDLLGSAIKIKRRPVVSGSDVLLSWFNDPSKLPQGFQPGAFAKFKINNRTVNAHYLERDDVTPKGELKSLDVQFGEYFSATISAEGTLTKVNFLDSSLSTWYEEADTRGAEDVIGTGYRLVLEALEMSLNAINERTAESMPTVAG